MGVLIGVDVGTQGTKAVAVTPEGTLLGSASCEYGVLHPRPMWAEQWPDVWVNAVYQAVRTCLERAGADPRDQLGISISGLYGGSGVPVDEKVQPLRPCLIWMDRRAVAEEQWIREHVDMERLFHITGNYVDTYYGFLKILWIKHNEPRIWQRIHKFLPPTSYVIHRLTGELAIDLSSAGNLAGLFDLSNRRWSEEMASALGIPLERMPERLLDSKDVVGTVTADAARASGLREGLPVVAGGIDAPMETLGVGAFEEGDHVAMMGTSTCWGIVHGGDRLAKEIVSMPHVVEPQTQVYSWAGAATSGALARWFRDELGAVEVESARLSGVDPYALLDLKAANVPSGSEGLVVLPYFMGERAPVWDPGARGMVMGLTLYHTRAHVFRAFLEAAAYALRHSIEVGQELGLPLKEPCIVTGGVTKSKLWLQILADVTGRPVLTLAEEAGAPLGNALLAGMGVGAVGGYEEIRNWIEHRLAASPRPDHHERYQAYYTRYRRIYEVAREEMHALAALGEGTAGGSDA